LNKRKPFRKIQQIILTLEKVTSQVLREERYEVRITNSLPERSKAGKASLEKKKLN